MLKRLIIYILAILLLVGEMAACGGSGSSNANSTPTTTASSSSLTPGGTPIQLVSVVTAVSPNSFNGITCGNTTTFTFSSVITVNPGNAGGPVSYTWIIGSSHIPGQVTFAPGQTSAS